MRIQKPVKAGRAGAEARFESNKDTDCLRRPAYGTKLKTITIEDHITGSTKRIKVYQATRKNQVFTKCFGRKGNFVGWDKIMRTIRADCVTRWLEI